MKGINVYMTGADPENFSRGGPTLGKKKPITHTVTHTHSDTHTHTQRRSAL